MTPERSRAMNAVVAAAHEAATHAGHSLCVRIYACGGYETGSTHGAGQYPAGSKHEHHLACTGHHRHAHTVDPQPEQPAEPLRQPTTITLSPEETDVVRDALGQWAAEYASPEEAATAHALRARLA